MEVGDLGLRALTAILQEVTLPLSVISACCSRCLMPSLSSCHCGFLGLWHRENKCLDQESFTMPCLLSLQLRLRLASYPKITQTTLVGLPSSFPECQGTLLTERPTLRFLPHHAWKTKTVQVKTVSLPLTVKVKKALILCANIWCYQGVQCGLKQTAEMHTNWKKMVFFLMWKNLLREGCFASAHKEVVENVIWWPLTMETALKMTVGRCWEAAEGLGNEMGLRPWWDPKVAGTGGCHLAER